MHSFINLHLSGPGLSSSFPVLSVLGLPTQSYGSLIPDLIAGILSGLFLALIFFAIKEYWNPPPDMNGRWYFESHIRSSTLKSLNDVRVKWEVMLFQEGQTLRGTGEKIFEDNAQNAFGYAHEKRVHGDFEGYIDKYYFRRNCITMHLKEHGRIRESSAIFELRKDGAELVGILKSTAAETEGTMVWSRDHHSSRFSELIRAQRFVDKTAKKTDNSNEN